MSTGAWKDDIHIFRDEGCEILFQVNSGIFFEIDTLVKDVLVLAHTHTREDIVASLRGFETKTWPQSLQASID